VDLSEQMLARARQRARERQLDHATFAAADASAYGFEGQADLLFSRFGVMFFPDPQAAFRNLRTALKPGGRLTFITWRDVKLNPWQSVPLQAALKFVPPPEPLPPDAPGPFALADPARFQSLLTGAGFTQVALEPCDEPMILGSSLEQAVGYTLAIGPAARLLAEASPEVRKKASVAIEQALTPFAGAAGVVLPAATWLASARA
jgi:SAM-dependent methyltransferase